MTSLLKENSANAAKCTPLQSHYTICCTIAPACIQYSFFPITRVLSCLSVSYKADKPAIQENRTQRKDWHSCWCGESKLIFWVLFLQLSTDIGSRFAVQWVQLTKRDLTGMDSLNRLLLPRHIFRPRDVEHVKEYYTILYFWIPDRLAWKIVTGNQSLLRYFCFS